MTALVMSVRDVGVECYGRQAEKGGGWVSFVPDAGMSAHIINLKPNTTGVWCTEFGVTHVPGVPRLPDGRRQSTR